MDFVLVSNDEVNGAEQKAAKFANPNRTLVLIDAEKIEKMAEDEEYRKKYENIISGASSQLEKMKESLGGILPDVKTFGIKVDDNGNTSFFGVVDKSLAAQKERMAKKSEDCLKERKATNKESFEKQKEAIKADKMNQSQSTEDLETITASTVEDLIKKIKDSFYARLSDNVRTQAEMQVGTQIDFKL